MSDWLHWIGKAHYTQHSFIKEAERYGVTRRVSLNVAKKMSFGDKVYCTMLDGKTGVIFGSFIISKLTGLSAEVVSDLGDEYETELADEGGDVVIRGCGEYTEGNEYAVRCELPNIIDILSQMSIDDKDIGKPMVGGLFVRITKIRLIDIPFRPGFRQIRGDLLLTDACFTGRNVRGQYYVDDRFIKANEPNSLQEYGWVQAVEDYRRY